MAVSYFQENPGCTRNNDRDNYLYGEQQNQK